MNGSWFPVGMAVLAAITHSLVPDHWVPYVVVARAHRWSRRRTVLMAAAGALAHLLSTAAAGLILGLFYQRFLETGGEAIEQLTGLLVIGFGLWFLWRGRKAGDGRTHAEVCRHGEREAERADSLLLGAFLGLRPCVEALPIFLAAASRGMAPAALAVAGWAVASVAGMVGIVYFGRNRLERIKLGWLESHAESLAGGIIVAVGLGALIFGLLHG
ncbi:MAG: hypothetical protein ACM3XS_09825 [Bacteroidota bacterium]